MLLNLKAEMIKGKISAADIAAVIGRTDRSVRSKISGRTSFTYSEARSIRDSFFPDLSIEYLFEPGPN